MLEQKYQNAKRDFADANFDLDDFCMRFLLKHFIKQSMLNTMLALAKSQMKKAKEGHDK